MERVSHNHGLDPSCNEHPTGDCIIQELTARVEAAAVALYEYDRNASTSPDHWPDWQDEDNAARGIVREATRAALAAADKAATITTEWGVRYSDSGYVSRHMSEGSARETADTHNAHDKTNWGQSFDMQAVSRTVTEWKETPDDHPTA